MKQSTFANRVLAWKRIRRLGNGYAWASWCRSGGNRKGKGKRFRRWKKYARQARKLGIHCEEYPKDIDLALDA